MIVHVIGWAIGFATGWILVDILRLLWAHLHSDDHHP